MATYGTYDIDGVPCPCDWELESEGVPADVVLRLLELDKEQEEV